MNAKRWTSTVLLVLLSAWSCTFATDVDLIEIQGAGLLFGQAFLDLNGNGTVDAADQPMRASRIVLTTPGSGEVVLAATTDTLGLFTIDSVPVGTYRLGLDSAVLSDSLTALGAGAAFTVEVGDTTFFSLGASFPTLSLQEVRAAAPGRRVFTLGVALNARLPGTDGTVHVLDTTTVTYLRATSVSTIAANLQVGDSVRMLGRTSTDNGQPVLTSVTPFLLQRGLTLPPPVEEATANAATASGGSLDAALVQIRAAEISDTLRAGNGDFHFWANDGSDSVEVVFKWFRGISSVGIRPDTIVRINRLTGLLTPVVDGLGNIRWRLLPRAASEVILENKGADLAVTTAFAPVAANTGDTVQIRVVVTNQVPAPGAGVTHVTATGVAVTDTIPTGLVFLSASTTSGSYSDTSGTWTVGDIAPTAADTLLISAEVTAAPGTVTNTAVLQGLVSEIETNGANDTGSANLTVN